MRSSMSIRVPLAVNPALGPSIFTTRLSDGLLSKRSPPSVCRLTIMTSSNKTWTMSVSSQTPAVVNMAPRMCMPFKSLSASRFIRISGPRLSSNCANRSAAPVLRPLSGTDREFSELALMWIVAPSFLRKTLSTITGCAPRTKTAAGSLLNRPFRSGSTVSRPEALLRTRLRVIRKSACWTSIALNRANPPSMGISPPP
jgi:hypothetical protein